MKSILLVSIFSGSIWQIVANTSVFGLFILSVLAFMSVISWVIIFHKWRLFKAVEADNAAFLKQFNNSRKLSDAIGQAKSLSGSTLAPIFMAGFQEIDKLNELKNEGGGLQSSKAPLTVEDFEIVEMTMERALSEQTAILEQKVIFLASTANSAPFLGLLGTVVGIMDSFWSIGERGSASLAVVAPGIAEALLATIVGLGAAIPAVIAYNWASNKLKSISESSNNFILNFVTRARREII